MVDTPKFLSNTPEIPYICVCEALCYQQQQKSTKDEKAIVAYI